MILKEATEVLFTHQENKPSKIMVVDDEPTSLMIMLEALKTLVRLNVSIMALRRLKKRFYFNQMLFYLILKCQIWMALRFVDSLKTTLSPNQLVSYL